MGPRKLELGQRGAVRRELRVEERGRGGAEVELVRGVGVVELGGGEVEERVGAGEGFGRGGRRGEGGEERVEGEEAVVGGEEGLAGTEEVVSPSGGVGMGVLVA